MTQISTVLAKLSGLRKALVGAVNENVSRNRSPGEVLTRANFSPEQVEHYFVQTARHVEELKKLLPDLYDGFQAIETKPSVDMAEPNTPKHFAGTQVERLIRDIDQVFEIRANSELASPQRASPRCVFISHGRSNDWRVVQPFIERDVKLPTIELVQEPNLGRTLIEKLSDNAHRCDNAVIVMTGDDVANENEMRVRENVLSMRRLRKNSRSICGCTMSTRRTVSGVPIIGQRWPNCPAIRGAIVLVAHGELCDRQGPV